MRNISGNKNPNYGNHTYNGNEESKKMVSKKMKEWWSNKDNKIKIENRNNKLSKSKIGVKKSLETCKRISLSKKGVKRMSNKKGTNKFPKICQNCKKEFLKIPERKFCSRECFKKGIGKVMSKIYEERGSTSLSKCFNCNKEFKRRNSKIRKKLFCSRNCYNSYFSRLKNNKYWCNSCKKYLDKIYFYKDKNNKYGIRSHCIKCMKRRTKCQNTNNQQQKA
jgi:hypothetical protein